MRGHKTKLLKGICLNDIKKCSSPQRSIDTWNGLKEEVITAKNLKQLKEKPDKYKYRDYHTSVPQALCTTM